MIFVLIGIGLFLFALSFLITEKNAPSLLSGYNTLPPEEKAKVDFPALVAYFRKFHQFLGISLILFGFLIQKYLGENAGGIFLVMYPIIAYMIYIPTTSKFSTTSKVRSLNTVAVWVLGITLVLVLGLFGYGMKEDSLIIQDSTLTFEGMYGEELSKDDIAKVEIVQSLPPIAVKVNGFALGNHHKGYFKTKNGETIKLILNNSKEPFLFIEKQNKKKIYFNSSIQDTQTLLAQLKN